jgi:hypothetical protein
MAFLSQISSCRGTRILQVWHTAGMATSRQCRSSQLHMGCLKQTSRRLDMPIQRQQSTEDTATSHLCCRAPLRTLCLTQMSRCLGKPIQQQQQCTAGKETCRQY